VSITKWLEFVVKHYQARYPEHNAADRINQYHEYNPDTGICYDVCKFVQSKVPDVEIVILFVTCQVEGGFAELPLHCVLKQNGLFYDTYNPEGVDMLEKLTWVVSNDVADEVFIAQSDEDYVVGERCYSMVPYGPFVYDLFRMQ